MNKMLNKQSMFKAVEDIVTIPENIQDKFHWDRSGIRTQLIRKNDKSFVTDFIFEKKDNHLHLLNFASPGWTSSLAIGDHVAEILP